jgi:hypothetical protein
MPPWFALVAPKSREGTIRRTLALTGFAVGIVAGLSAFACYVVDRHTSFGEGLGALILAVVFSPVVGMLLAAIGAGFGCWIELVIRMAKRRPGESVLLTLIGDDREL